MSAFEYSDAANMLSRVTVHGDRAKLEQVLRNFLSNAFKFTPNEGTVEVDVSVLKNIAMDNGQGDRRDYLRIKVIDNGPGIAKVREINSRCTIIIYMKS